MENIIQRQINLADSLKLRKKSIQSNTTSSPAKQDRAFEVSMKMTTIKRDHLLEPILKQIKGKKDSGPRNPI